MRLAILGAGRVGAALGMRWAQLGHEIVYGVRDPDAPKVRALLDTVGRGVRVAKVRQAADMGDLITLATSWNGAEDALSRAGDLGGKVLIDCTNPFVDGELVVGHTTSGAEQVAGWATGARVVKAFNTTGTANMVDPDYAGHSPTMFICGDDPAAKETVAGLVQQLGFESCDCGSLKSARYLEPVAGLWVHLAYRQGLGPNIAFKLLRR